MDDCITGAQGAEYDRLAAELRTALTDLEKREKVLKANEESVRDLIATLLVYSCTNKYTTRARTKCDWIPGAVCSEIWTNVIFSLNSAKF